MSDRRRPRPLGTAVGALAGLALLASACAGQSDDTAAATTTSSVEVPAPPEPVRGGELVFGVEADTGTPWTPAKSTCAVSCHAVMRSVYDTLTVINDDGAAVPNLASAVEPNADFTQWRITARDGVEFHDGTPFDGRAIVDNLTRQKTSFLTGRILEDVVSIEVDPADPMTAVVTMTTPWVSFPTYLAAQVGYMASPTWLAAADADPSLESQPVGTGPFVFESYAPGEGYRGVRNERYWRDGLPYLDAIEFRIIPDATTREQALLAGDIDAMHTDSGATIVELRERGDEVEMEEYAELGETSHWLLNVSQEGSPLADRRVRCALAHATDVETILAATNAGLPEAANGPYGPGRIGHLQETGYPEFDPDEARRLIEEWEAENGPVELTYATTPDARNLQVAQLVQQMWEDAGVSTSVEQLEQGQFILSALQGSFQVFQWRNPGGEEPDNDYVLWHSSTAQPPGQLAINFGRIRDAVIDENLEAIRTNPDPEARRAAAEQINRRFAEECYMLWLGWTVWAIPHRPEVAGFGTLESPDGESVASYGSRSGAPYPQELWMEG